jgi:hypothetical protein
VCTGAGKKGASGGKKAKKRKRQPQSALQSAPKGRRKNFENNLNK